MEWEFAGEIVEWRGPAPYLFVELPPDADAYLHEHLAELTYGWGCIPATVRVGGTTETTALMPRAGRYLVPMKVRLRRSENLELGDTATVVLTVRDP